MKYGKYKFGSYKEFQNLKNLATTRGIETMGEFNKFIKEYFSKNKK